MPFAARLTATPLGAQEHLRGPAGPGGRPTTVRRSRTRQGQTQRPRCDPWDRVPYGEADGHHAHTGGRDRERRWCPLRGGVESGGRGRCRGQSGHSEQKGRSCREVAENGQQEAKPPKDRTPAQPTRTMYWNQTGVTGAATGFCPPVAPGRPNPCCSSSGGPLRSSCSAPRARDLASSGRTGCSQDVSPGSTIGQRQLWIPFVARLRWQAPLSGSHECYPSEKASMANLVADLDPTPRSKAANERSRASRPSFPYRIPPAAWVRWAGLGGGWGGGGVPGWTRWCQRSWA